MKDFRVYLKAAGLVIKAWREKAGISQAQLAERASATRPVSASLPPLSADDVSNLERGIVKRLEFADIERICIALGRSVGEFSPAVEQQLERAEKLLQAEQYLRKIRQGGEKDDLTTTCSICNSTANSFNGIPKAQKILP